MKSVILIAAFTLVVAVMGYPTVDNEVGADPTTESEAETSPTTPGKESNHLLTAGSLLFFWNEAEIIRDCVWSIPPLRARVHRIQ